MNLFALNGATLNGSTGALVIAVAAVFANTADVTAAAVRQAEALLPVSSGASVTASATRIHKPESLLGGQAGIYALSSQRIEASSSMSGSADVQAFVLRVADATAEVNAGAEVLAIPASVLAFSNQAGSALVSFEATRIQHGITDLSGLAEVELTASPVVTRYVTPESLTGSASVRIESTVNDVMDGYAEPIGTASISTPAVGVLLRVSYSNVTTASSVAANATLIQPGYADAPVSGELEILFVTVRDGGAAFPVNTADVSAEATRVKQPVVDAGGSASLLASASQFHGSSAAALSSSAQVVASALATRIPVLQQPLGSASVLAAGTRVLESPVDVSCSGDLVPDATRMLFASALFTSDAEHSIDARVWEQGVVNLTVPGAELEANATRIVNPTDILIEGVCEAYCLPFFIGRAAMGCDAEMTADSVFLVFADIAGSSEATPAEPVFLVSANIITGSGGVSAAATRTVLPSADLQASVEIDVTPVLAERGESAVIASAELVVTPVLAERGEADIVAGCEVFTNPVIAEQGYAQAITSADLVVTPVLAERGESIIDVGVSINADPSRVVAPTVDISSSSSVVAQQTRIAFGQADIDCQVTLFADTIANADSIDPPERTFERAQLTPEFIRPEQVTEFTRSA